MNHRITAVLAAMLAGCAATAAVAQSAPAAPATMPLKAEKDAKLRYFTIETLTPKPGARLWTIMSKNFIPAAKAAGVPVPVVYHAETGSGVTIVITPLPGGLADLEWTMSPDDVKFMNELGKQLGGADKAEALWKEYNDGIAGRTREIIHEHTN